MLRNQNGIYKIRLIIVLKEVIPRTFERSLIWLIYLRLYLKPATQRPVTVLCFVWALVLGIKVGILLPY